MELEKFNLPGGNRSGVGEEFRSLWSPPEGSEVSRSFLTFTASSEEREKKEILLEFVIEKKIRY